MGALNLAQTSLWITEVREQSHGSTDPSLNEPVDHKRERESRAMEALNQAQMSLGITMMRERSHGSTESSSNEPVDHKAERGEPWGH